MADVFVSYAREDKARAEKVVGLLEDYGWDVFWDQETRAGTHWPKVLEDELNAARCLIALWTTNSIDSRWVRIESYEALQTEKLVPVLLDDVRAPLEFRQTQTFDLIGWNGDRGDTRLAHLLTDLTALVSAPRGAGGAHRPAKIVVPPTLQRAIPAATLPPAITARDAAEVPVVTKPRLMMGLGLAVAAAAVALIATLVDFAPQPKPQPNVSVTPAGPPPQATVATPSPPPVVPASIGPPTAQKTAVPPPVPSTGIGKPPGQPQKSRAPRCGAIEEKFQQTGQITSSERDFLRSKECQ